MIERYVYKNFSNGKTQKAINQQCHDFDKKIEKEK